LPPHLESLIEAHSDVWNAPAAVHPNNKIECVQMLAVLDEFLVPAPKDFIVRELTRLAAHFWSDRTEQQWAIVLQDYADDLHRYPAALIRDVLKGWRLTEKWFPKEGELLSRLDAKINPLRLRRYRLKQCLKTPDRPPRLTYYDDLSPEEQAKIDAAVASLGPVPRRPDPKPEAQGPDFDQQYAASLPPEERAAFWRAKMAGQPVESLG
jgi:hypothetical protein